MLATGAPEQVPLRGGLGRFTAITEVVLAFGLVHVAYRALKHFTVFGQWDARTNFIPGLTMVAFTVALLLLYRRSFAAYGLSAKRWSYHLSLGLACSLLLLAVVAVGLAATRVHFDASKPPDPHAPHQFLRIAGLAVVVLPAFILVLRLVGRRRAIIERIPPIASVSAIFALLAVLPLVAAHFHRPSMWVQALWLFFGAGFGEEIFFRGYIQSRIDQAFGFPFRLLGVEFGPGLLISSLLFGLVHALNTVDYFGGRFDFGWSYGLQNVFTGLFFGCIRARTGSVLPGAIVHGLQDAFARIPSLLP
ncbi:MAG TPA: CPBP family intramembrane glutamic endopeptidase [Candidatus Binatia bacterium]|nr:CPBP family intramembrane glutamic endopeptidase [Candidatus Binatia bacterium]